MSAEALSNLSSNLPDSAPEDAPDSAPTNSADAPRGDDIRETGDGALPTDALAAAEGTSRRKGTSGKSDKAEKADKAEKHTPMMLQRV